MTPTTKPFSTLAAALVGGTALLLAATGASAQTLTVVSFGGSYQEGQSKALLWVRDRMGHSSITTTEKYIHAVDLVQHDDVDGYQAEVCEALRRGH